MASSPSTMRAYLKQIQIMFQDTLIYRADAVSRVLSWGIRFLISAFLWLAIMGSQEGEIAGYSLEEALTYFLLMQIVAGFVHAQSGFLFSDEIQYGNLANRLVQPVYFPLLVMSMEVGKIIFNFCTNLLLYVGIALALPQFFVFHFSVATLAMGAISLIFAFLINFSLISCIGLLAFWTDSSRRFIYHFYAIVTLLSGIIIPLELFPSIVQKILNLLPFPYMFYFPVHILQSSTLSPELWLGLGIQVAYSLVLTAAMAAIYSLGLLRFEAVGR